MASIREILICEFSVSSQKVCGGVSPGGETSEDLTCKCIQHVTFIQISANGEENSRFPGVKIVVCIFQNRYIGSISRGTPVLLSFRI